MLHKLILILFLFSSTLFANNFKLFSRFNYYTQEDSVTVIAKSDSVEDLVLKIFCNADTIETLIHPQKITEIKINSDQFNFGENEIEYEVNSMISDTLLITKLPFKKNEIKIDKLTGGLIREGKPFIPFGFYCYFPVQEKLLEQEVVNGFNMVSPYQNIVKNSFEDRLEYMDRAHELDMMVNYNLLSVSGGGGVNSSIPKGFDQNKLDKLLIEEVKKIMNHPALLSWYISDEPVGNRKTPEELERIYNIIKNIDPYHPITVVFMHPKRAKDYKGSMDIVMADPYPIPEQSVLKVNRITASLKKEFNFDKPLWIVPQAFGGNEWWIREPTAQEIRIMTYSAILEGATGIKYFVRKGLNGFPKSQKTWNEAGEIALEIAEITPFLLSSEVPLSIKCDQDKIITKAFRDGKRDLIIVANLQNIPIDFSVEFQNSIPNFYLSVLSENRKVKINANMFTDKLSAFGVNIYQIINEENPSKFIHPENLIIDSGFENSVTVGVPNHCYAYAGSDQGSTYFVDATEYYDGYHSLKLVTPQYNLGAKLNFHRITLKPNTDYTISVMAKGKEIPIKMDKKSFWQFWKWFKNQAEPKFFFNLNFGNFDNKDFELSPNWKEYKFTINSGENSKQLKRINTYIELIGKGKAWFDNLQVYPSLD